MRRKRVCAGYQISLTGVKTLLHFASWVVLPGSSALTRVSRPMEANGEWVGGISGIILLLRSQQPTATLWIKRFVLIVFVLTLKMKPRSLDVGQTQSLASYHWYLRKGVRDPQKGMTCPEWVAPFQCQDYLPSSSLSYCPTEVWMASGDSCWLLFPCHATMC